MSKKTDTEEAFFLLAVRLLEDSPENLAAFKSFWEAKDYRLAYLFAHRIIDGKKDEKIDAEVDKRFYWGFIS